MNPVQSKSKSFLPCRFRFFRNHLNPSAKIQIIENSENQITKNLRLHYKQSSSRHPVAFIQPLSFVDTLLTRCAVVSFRPGASIEQQFFQKARFIISATSPKLILSRKPSEIALFFPSITPVPFWPDSPEIANATIAAEQTNAQLSVRGLHYPRGLKHPYAPHFNKNTYMNN